ncbi:MAG: nucleotide exchange factor GrpE [Proteobacteria bacterium]|nr:nucleotide exchange factor GrpE [Pseudomonadota bacterium]MBU1640798.1 nucleotide exchange factor GrpE [Pseudomonadota bacterium]
MSEIEENLQEPADDLQAVNNTGLQDESVQQPEGEVDELAMARQECHESKDQLLRLAAEFDNYKKRMERDRSRDLKYAEESIIKELLPSLDNLERAIEQGKKTGNNSELLQGVELTIKGLITTLEKFQVTPLESMSQPFDPNLHEALAMDHSDEVAENHVLVEFEKGYYYKDKLLRPAKVVVSKGPAAKR